MSVTTSVKMPSIKRTMKLFFDRDAVMSRIPKAERIAMSQGGAYVAKRMQWILRTKKGPSVAGSPPHSHSGLLKKFLFFAYDATSGHVIVGPALLNQISFTSGFVPQSGTGPQLLEEGGEALTFEDALGYSADQVPDDDDFTRADLRRSLVKNALSQIGKRERTIFVDETERGGRRIGHFYRFRKVRVAARPYKELPLRQPEVQAKLAKIWADSIKA